MAEKVQSLVSANTIELHYWFEDGSHSMNAFVHSQCEVEFLAFIKEVNKIFGINLILETEPLENGGLRRIFKFSKKDKSLIISTVVISLITGLFVTPITTSITTFTTKLVEKLMEDPEIIRLQKENLEKTNEILDLDIELKRQKVDQNKVLEKRRSNFYEQLVKFPKVSKISIQTLDDERQVVEPERFVDRTEFVNFVMVSDDYEPEIHENATIEIISPVLKKGDYKWRGFFKGDPVSFNMKSSEFKTMVQTGQVEFRNGTSIDCFLEIKRKIDGEGLVKNDEYNIIRVNRYFDNENPVETQEGRFHRQKKEGDRSQLKMSFQKPSPEESTE